MKFFHTGVLICCLSLLALGSAQAAEGKLEDCDLYKAEPGATITMPEDSYAYVPKGTKLFTLENHNTVNLNGNHNKVMVKSGEVNISVPENPEGKWDNFVSTCTQAMDKDKNPSGGTEATNPLKMEKTIPNKGTTIIQRATSAQKDCVFRALDAEIIVQPKHGKVAVAQRETYPEPSDAQCRKTKIPGTFVDYTPDHDYVGPDFVSIRFTNPLGNSKSAKDLELSLNVVSADMLRKQNEEQNKLLNKGIAEAFHGCRNKRLNGELKTFQDSAQCSNAGIMQAAKDSHFRYMDLIEDFCARHLENAKSEDLHRITQDEASRKVFFWLGEINAQSKKRDAIYWPQK